MTELELLKHISEVLDLILLVQVFLFLKTIFGIVAGFINGFLD